MVTPLLLLFYHARGLPAAFSAEDREQYLETLAEAQDPATGMFGDFVTTQNAVEAYQILGKEVPNKDKLCKSLHARRKKASNVSNLAHLYMGLAQLRCQVDVPPEVTAKIKSSLSSGRITNLDLATRTVYALVDAGMVKLDGFALDTVLDQIKAIKTAGGELYKESSSDKKDGTAYKTALALRIAADLHDHVPSQKEAAAEFLTAESEKTIPAMEGSAKKKSGLLVYQDSLTATTTILDTIMRAGKITGSYGMTKARLEALSNYLLANTKVDSIGAMLNIMSGTRILRDNPVYTPLTYEFSTPFCLSGQSSCPVTVSVGDAWGEPVDGGAVALAKPAVEAFETTSTGKYTLNVAPLLAKKKPGVFKAVATVGVTEVELTSKLAYGVKFNSATAKMYSYAKTHTEVKGGAKEKLTHPNSSEKVFKLSKKSKVRVDFKLGDLDIVPQQIMAQLASSDGGPAQSLVARPTNGKFNTVFDVTRDPWKKLPAGKYDVNLLFGDARLEKPVVWNVGAVKLTPVPPKPPRRKHYEPVNDDVPRFEPKGDLNHTFNDAEKKPVALLSLIFAVVTCVPFLGLLYLLFVVMGVTVKPPSGQAGVEAMVFQGSLVAIGGILLAFWVSVGIFKSLGLLTVAAGGAAIAGYGPLKFRSLSG